MPTPDVSVVDLTVRLEKEATYAEICAKLKEASETSMKGEKCEKVLSLITILFQESLATLRTWLCPLTSWETTDLQSSTPRLGFSCQEPLSSWSPGTTTRMDTPTESSTSSTTCTPRLEMDL